LSGLFYLTKIFSLWNFFWIVTSKCGHFKFQMNKAFPNLPGI
jgi:hypothetical protein